MILLNPNNLAPINDPKTQELLKKTVQFFENKGKAQLKEDDHERTWYADFLDFQKQNELFSQFLTPSEFGGEGCRWDTHRNCHLNEILGFYGLAYWYTWQVTILGLGPIWMSDNIEVKKKTAEYLKNGGIFAFGLSEKEHGADLYSSEMALEGSGPWRANGRKYYIGNANEASLVSVFAKYKVSGEYSFFVADPKHENYDCIQNVTNSQNYVAEFELKDYPITEKELLSSGRHAWDTSLNTVNVGKYNLGWATIGICTHAFYEAINHASSRRLFDSTVTDFAHIRQLFVDAYAKLVAMKTFALRASDYMRTASLEDRRYLLYNPIVKMKVTTQGEDVINHLWDVIAAKGFEKDMYFEMAARDIRALPKLEGTVHVNMALIIKFMANYFFKPGQFEEIGYIDDLRNDDFLFAQGPTKGLGKIRFHDYKKAYDRVNLPNANVFKKQISALKRLLIFARPQKSQAKDFDFLLKLGELFTLVAYGQLIIENKDRVGIDEDLLDQIFDFMVRDFSTFALHLMNKSTTTGKQRWFLKQMIKTPQHNSERFDRVWEKHITPLNGLYEMKP
jgi:acyl-CoA dehydrogenase